MAKPAPVRRPISIHRIDLLDRGGSLRKVTNSGLRKLNITNSAIKNRVQRNTMKELVGAATNKMIKDLVGSARIMSSSDAMKSVKVGLSILYRGSSACFCQKKKPMIAKAIPQRIYPYQSWNGKNLSSAGERINRVRKKRPFLSCVLPFQASLVSVIYFIWSEV